MLFVALPLKAQHAAIPVQIAAKRAVPRWKERPKSAPSHTVVKLINIGKSVA